MLSWLLDEPLAESAFPALRMVFYASAPMPVGLLRRGIERLGPIFMQGYGQTESGPLATTLRPEEHELAGPAAERLESCGRAVAGVDLRVLDGDGNECEPGAVGELAIRSPFNMIGYLGQPELTDRRAGRRVAAHRGHGADRRRPATCSSSTVRRT